jgi:hypothetical protein
MQQEFQPTFNLLAVAGLSVCRSNQPSAQAGQARARARSATVVVIVTQIVRVRMRNLLRFN